MRNLRTLFRSLALLILLYSSLSQGNSSLQEAGLKTSLAVCETAGSAINCPRKQAKAKCSELSKDTGNICSTKMQVASIGDIEPNSALGEHLLCQMNRSSVTLNCKSDIVDNYLSQSSQEEKAGLTEMLAGERITDLDVRQSYCEKVFDKCEQTCEEEKIDTEQRLKIASEVERPPLQEKLDEIKKDLENCQTSFKIYHTSYQSERADLVTKKSQYSQIENSLKDGTDLNIPDGDPNAGGKEDKGGGLFSNPWLIGALGVGAGILADRFLLKPQKKHKEKAEELQAQLDEANKKLEELENGNGTTDGTDTTDGSDSGVNADHVQTSEQNQIAIATAINEGNIAELDRFACRVNNLSVELRSFVLAHLDAKGATPSCDLGNNTIATADGGTTSTVNAPIQPTQSRSVAGVSSLAQRFDVSGWTAKVNQYKQDSSYEALEIELKGLIQTSADFDSLNFAFSQIQELKGHITSSVQAIGARLEEALNKRLDALGVPHGQDGINLLSVAAS